MPIDSDDLVADEGGTVVRVRPRVIVFVAPSAPADILSVAYGPFADRLGQPVNGVPGERAEGLGDHGPDPAAQLGQQLRQVVRSIGRDGVAGGVERPGAGRDPPPSFNVAAQNRTQSSWNCRRSWLTRAGVTLSRAATSPVRCPAVRNRIALRPRGDRVRA
jgi:hypothetical protein